MKRIIDILTISLFLEQLHDEDHTHTSQLAADLKEKNNTIAVLQTQLQDMKTALTTFRASLVAEKEEAIKALEVVGRIL